MLKIDMNTYSRTHDDPGGPLVLMIEDDAPAVNYLSSEKDQAAASSDSRIGELVGMMLMLSLLLAFCLAR